MTMGFFVWLCVFMLIGIAANKLRGMLWVNGALWFCYVTGALVIFSLGTAALSAKASDPAISLVGNLIVPYLVAFFLARRFKARQVA